jgi:hypothetical protein
MEGKPSAMSQIPFIREDLGDEKEPDLKKKYIQTEEEKIRKKLQAK